MNGAKDVEVVVEVNVAVENGLDISIDTQGAPRPGRP